MTTGRPAILLVCLGNICRSPLAEAALRIEAERAGLSIEIDSAGTGDWHAGNPPDPRAQAVARAAGTDISDLRARQVTSDDFCRFTHIFAMDAQNLADLHAVMPRDATARVALLLDAVPGREGASVRDPYYGGEQLFEDTWDDVSLAARMIVSSLAG
ncbi:low molecular weight phosphotyrosine protein phosphatase [Tsuneonella sp. YG55]|uniref:protein-tyrosine-phosphatase n=1 Tax=Tsuneonella litorea TaxID=2976475 RepID=A0A9X2W2Y1_9SPHN|nr:low molecular weight protein-tyrosine-phosphatase [Tsuneonella litorea]MCT2558821.1 low molecular weight phosphotyrosine protein phosphatase [Tsuneonella litorea]